MNIPVVYEDNYLLVLEKPAGLLTIPKPGPGVRTLSSILNDDLKERGASYRLHPCHRLDKETSGLIIYAKGKSIQKKIMDQFRDKRIEKKYIAFVQGRLSKPQGQITLAIENKTAVTKYMVKEERNGFTIVEARPLTGRTNQIRIHFKEIGHPILGETKFAFRRDFKIKARRLCLHAQGITFFHPVTGETISLHTQLPPDLQQFLTNHN